MYRRPIEPSTNFCESNDLALRETLRCSSSSKPSTRRRQERRNGREVREHWVRWSHLVSASSDHVKCIATPPPALSGNIQPTWPAKQVRMIWLPSSVVLSPSLAYETAQLVLFLEPLGLNTGLSWSRLKLFTGSDIRRFCVALATLLLKCA